MRCRFYPDLCQERINLRSVIFTLVQKSAPDAFRFQSSQTSFSSTSAPTLVAPPIPSFVTPAFGTLEGKLFAMPNFNAPDAGSSSMRTGAAQQGSKAITHAHRRLKR